MELAKAQQSQTEVAFYTSPLCTPVAITLQSKQNITWVLESAQACQILLASVYLVGLVHVIRHQGGLATELYSTAHKQCFAAQAHMAFFFLFFFFHCTELSQPYIISGQKLCMLQLPHDICHAILYVRVIIYN